MKRYGLVVAAPSLFFACAWHTAHTQQTNDVLIVIRNNYTSPVRIYAAPEFIRGSGTTVHEMFIGIVPGNSSETFPLKWPFNTIQVRGEIQGGSRIIWDMNTVEPGDTWTYSVRARLPPGTLPRPEG